MQTLNRLPWSLLTHRYVRLLLFRIVNPSPHTQATLSHSSHPECSFFSKLGQTRGPSRGMSGGFYSLKIRLVSAAASLPGCWPLLSEHLNVENHLGSIKIHWHRGVISSSLIWSFLFTPCIKRPSSHPELFSLTKQRSELRKQCRLSNDNKTMIAGDGQLRSLRALEIPGAGGGC